jgi:cell division protein ZapB
MKQKIQKMEEKINQLISLFESLEKENKLLKKKQNDWTKEKRLLNIKNEKARQKIDSMIERLKTMSNIDE